MEGGEEEDGSVSFWIWDSLGSSSHDIVGVEERKVDGFDGRIYAERSVDGDASVHGTDAQEVGEVLEEEVDGGVGGSC